MRTTASRNSASVSRSRSARSRSASPISPSTQLPARDIPSASPPMCVSFSPMRRLGRFDGRRRLLFQRQEPLGQRVDLLLQPLDHFPLLGDLPGKLLNGLFLFGRADFERRGSVRSDHGASSRGNRL